VHPRRYQRLEREAYSRPAAVQQSALNRRLDVQEATDVVRAPTGDVPKHDDDPLR
jgi:hypothetical protein